MVRCMHDRNKWEGGGYRRGGTCSLEVMGYGVWVIESLGLG